jgi:CHAT domain-containing protein/tetratricopeptide (TPR) repeat protein
MINVAVFPMGTRIQTRRLGSALLVVSGLLLWPVPLKADWGLAPGEPRLVAQARDGAVEVPAEVMEWRQQVGALYQQGKFQEAIPLQEQELAWTERSYRPDHPDMQIASEVYGKWAAQDSLCKDKNIQDRVVRWRIMSKINMLLYLGQISRAIEEAEEELSRRSITYGGDHLCTALIVSELGHYEALKGDYNKSLTLLSRGLVIFDKTLGPSHPLTATAMSNYAWVYRSVNESDPRAETLMLRALAIMERTQGANDTSTLDTLINVAIIYLEKGLYLKSEALYLRALAISDKTFGPNHPRSTRILGGLASLYYRNKSFNKAEAFLLRALAIKEKSLNGFTDPESIHMQISLGWLYEELSQHDRALGMYLSAWAGSMHSEYPVRIEALYGLGTFYMKQGDYYLAETQLLEALTICEQKYGSSDIRTSKVLSRIAEMYILKGEAVKAEPNLRRAMFIQSLFLQGRLPLLPTAEREAQLNDISVARDLAFSLVGKSGRSAELALFSKLNNYGLLLEIEKRQALLVRSPGAPQKLAEEIRIIINRLADANIPTAQRQELTKRIQDHERDLFRLLPPLVPQLVEPSQVARAMQTSDILVEFKLYQPLVWRQAKRNWHLESPRYLALVLNQAGTTRAIDLGPAAAIDPLIARALKESEASGGDPTELWRQVNEKVFPPALRQLLAGAKQWILAPDGELSRIPYAALPAPQDPQRRLTDTVALRLVSSGRNLLPLSTASTGVTSRPLVLADPDFGPAPARGFRWSRLPATAKEGRSISTLVQADLYEQAAATTTVLTNAKNPSLVHVASHGYYASASDTPPPAAPPPPAGGLRSAMAGLPASREDAMLNSGIVLAGANRNLRPDLVPAAAPSSASQGSADDGYLTAKEAAQLQLRGTELVVLSACDTASGEQQSGEGLFGLQRALSVAGARSTLLSLWKVDDDATAYFMERYYSLLKQGKGRMEALLAVQEEFRTKPERNAWEDYRYWAAFQLVGETGPIGGL